VACAQLHGYLNPLSAFIGPAWDHAQVDLLTSEVNMKQSVRATFAVADWLLLNPTPSGGRRGDHSSGIYSL
jgi:hypothetical protein